MKANQTDIKTLLGGPQQYVLPLYQRRYSWREKHWRTLRDDLRRIVEHPDWPAHFIGSFVTAPVDHAADQNVNAYRLIDGQQRLTTLLILLAALRDAADARDLPAVADPVHGQYLGNAYATGDAAYKLVPTERDRASLDAIWQRPAAPDETRIGQAYRYFREIFDRDSADFAALRNAVLGRLAAVNITLEPGDDPYMIFESLNAKGEKLTEADLLRNYFLMRLPQARADTLFRELWQPMEDALGEKLTDFFRHHLMREGASKAIRADAVYQSVKARVENQAGTAESVVNLLGELLRHATNYAKLLDPRKHVADAALADQIARLNRLRATTAYPLLLNVMDRQDGGFLPPDTLGRVLTLLETFLVRRSIANIASNALRRIFGSLCEDATLATDAEALLLRMRHVFVMKQRCPDNVQLAQHVIERHLYGGSNRDLARFLLERIELSYGHKEGPDPTAPKFQIEHALPQTLTPAWRDELCDEPERTDELHQRLIHTLGNLTLTGYNPELSNQPFAQKSARFADSSFRLNATSPKSRVGTLKQSPDAATNSPSGLPRSGPIRARAWTVSR